MMILVVNCKVCETEHSIEIMPLDLIKFLNGTNDCFLDLNEELRVLIFTGICTDCWEGI